MKRTPNQAHKSRKQQNGETIPIVVHCVHITIRLFAIYFGEWLVFLPVIVAPRRARLHFIAPADKRELHGGPITANRIAAPNNGRGPVNGRFLNEMGADVLNISINRAISSRALRRFLSATRIEYIVIIVTAIAQCVCVCVKRTAQRNK